jgi:hypothetical protein
MDVLYIDHRRQLVNSISLKKVVKMQIAFKIKKTNIPLETHKEMNLGDKVPLKQFNVIQRIFHSTTNVCFTISTSYFKNIS